jgi:YaiO family outer membrane protein
MRFLILVLALEVCTLAQVENILTRGRQLFGQNQAQKAFVLLNEYLKDNPNDLDARVLLGLICSWDKKYDEGRKAFQSVLQVEPDYKDAVLGLINLEFWSGHSARAEELALRGLNVRPQDPDYLAALVKVTAEKDAARSSAVKRAEITPGAASEYGWEASVAQSNIWFSNNRSSWHETSGSIARHVGSAWITARFSHATWNGAESNAIEVESYPGIRPGTYGYLAGAISPDGNLYAHRRFGAEIFQSFPHGFEGSAGMRYYRFGSNTFLYTGSVAKYFGDWWILGRTYITPDAVAGFSRSLQVSARRYHNDADHFVGLRFGMGASPFEVRSLNEIDVQHSTSLAVEALWKFRNGWRFRVNTGVARQTRVLFTGPLWQMQADGSLYYAF